MSTPRGIRNHNPGNLELGQKWQGLAPVQTDGRFCQFTAPIWGIRALARVLITYHRRYKVNSMATAIQRWAPDNENNTAAYIQSVAAHSGLPARAPIRLSTPEILVRIVPAIIAHENGQQPYRPELIREAIALALET